MSERLFQHGGDINSARSLFPDAPQPWIDLSTGINPVAYELPALDPALFERLPNPGDVEALQEIAAARFRAPPGHIVVAPGAQAIIQWLPRLFPAPAVAIPGFTYGGHAAAWRAANAKILPAVEDGLPAIVVNPNNPDGRRTAPDALAKLALRARPLVIDEAFADFDADAEPVPRAVRLRSFGKAYGLAGVRLGFAIAEPETAARLRDALGPWAVSGPALAAGRLALADDAWRARTRARLVDDAAWLDARLEAAGFEIVGGTLLFRLARRADASAAFAALASLGVLTRPFRARPDWLRFGLPRGEDRARVAAALKRV